MNMVNENGKKNAPDSGAIVRSGITGVTRRITAPD